MGITKRLWTDKIAVVFSIPDFHYSKRQNLLHEPRIPIIFGSKFQPRLCVDFDLWSSSYTYSVDEVRLWDQRCAVCLETDLRMDTRLDVLVCAHCGSQNDYSSRETYKQSSKKQLLPRKASDNHYKRLTFFKLWLKRLQGKEFNHVTQDHIDQIKQQLIKDKVDGIHYYAVKEAMKKQGLCKFYRNVVYIMTRLRGYPLVNLTASQEKVLVQMFCDFQQDFYDLGLSRINMMSYPYLIKKFCEIKGWNSMASVIPMLKSQQRIVAQDKLWKQVCLFKRWKFTPTTQYSYLDVRTPAHKKSSWGNSAPPSGLHFF